MSLVRGVGKYEKGEFPCSIDGKPTRDYRSWYDMIRRCTCEKYQQEYPNYIGCTISEEFLNFQNYMKWAVCQSGFGLEKRHLDKDFINPGNKIYSAETCVFLPPEINTVFGTCQAVRGDYPVGVSYHIRIGKYSSRLQTDKGRISLGYFTDVESAFIAYKIEKEKYIKYVAEKYIDVIDERVYNILINYEVKITD
jgi:hypothetical protein